MSRGAIFRISGAKIGGRTIPGQIVKILTMNIGPVNGQYCNTDCTRKIDFPRQIMFGSFVAEQSPQQTLPRQGLVRDNSNLSL